MLTGLQYLCQFQTINYGEILTYCVLLDVCISILVMQMQAIFEVLSHIVKSTPGTPLDLETKR